MKAIRVAKLDVHAHPTIKYTTFEADETCESGERYLFLGSSDGRVFCFTDKQQQRKLKAEVILQLLRMRVIMCNNRCLQDISRENKHSGGVSCMRLITSGTRASKFNILASGSFDRCIHLWSVQEKLFIQVMCNI